LRGGIIVVMAPEPECCRTTFPNGTPASPVHAETDASRSEQWKANGGTPSVADPRLDAPD
jgi:hypothetical protein